MKVRIAHGNEVDIATPAEMAAMLGAARDDYDVARYTRRKGVIKLDGTGAGTSSGKGGDLKVSSQFDWFCQRVTIGGAGAVSALVVFFENSSDSDANMMEVIQLGTAGRYSDSFSNEMYVPANSTLLIVVSGGVANLDVTYNIQIQYKRHPLRDI